MNQTKEQKEMQAHLEAIRLYFEKWGKNNEGVRTSDDLDPTFNEVNESIALICDAIWEY